MSVFLPGTIAVQVCCTYLSCLCFYLVQSLYRCVVRTCHVCIFTWYNCRIGVLYIPVMFVFLPGTITVQVCCMYLSCLCFYLVQSLYRCVVRTCHVCIFTWYNHSIGVFFLPVMFVFLPGTITVQVCCSYLSCLCFYLVQSQYRCVVRTCHVCVFTWYNHSIGVLFVPVMSVFLPGTITVQVCCTYLSCLYFYLVQLQYRCVVHTCHVCVFTWYNCSIGVLYIPVMFVFLPGTITVQVCCSYLSCLCFYLVQSQYRCVVHTCHVCVFTWYNHSTGVLYIPVMFVFLPGTIAVQVCCTYLSCLYFYLVQSQYRCVVHTCHVCVFTWYNCSIGVLYIPVMFVFLPGTITVQVCCSYLSCLYFYLVQSQYRCVVRTCQCLCFYLVQSQYRCVVRTCHVCVFTWYNHSTGVVCTCHVCVFTWYNHSIGVLYIPVMSVFLPGTITVQVCCTYLSCLYFYLVQLQYRCVVHTCHVCVFTWYNHSTGVLYVPVMFVFLPGTITVQVCCSYLSCLYFYLVQSQYRCVFLTCHVCVFTWYNHSIGVLFVPVMFVFLPGTITVQVLFVRTCHVCVFYLVQSLYRCVVRTWYNHSTGVVCTCHVCVFTWYNHSTGVLYVPVMSVFLPGTITVQVCCSYLVQSQYRCVVHTCHVCVFTWYNHSTGVLYIPVMFVFLPGTITVQVCCTYLSCLCFYLVQITVQVLFLPVVFVFFTWYKSQHRCFIFTWQAWESR